MHILTLNCWSHAIRYHLFSRDELALLASGIIERVNLGSSFITQTVQGREPYCLESDNNNHESAIALIIATLTDPLHGVLADPSGISAVGHRVAHGGKEFRQSVQINDQVLESIRELHHLAPLHLEANITGMEAAMAQLPAVPHVAVFDTAFHSSMPKAACLYPLPYEWYEKYGVRRYGFHGLSHLYLLRRAAALLGKPVSDCNLITVYLDRGVSLCAIKGGRSIDTSMGMTPLEGAVMETRCGDIDPGIHAHIMQELELSPQELEQILNQKSGILGITGHRADREHFLKGALEGNDRCRLALEMETYRLRKYIGSYLAIAGPLDGIVFTTGSGESEWLVREMVLKGLECFGILLHEERNRESRSDQEELEITGNGSTIRTFVIPSNEEAVIAEDVAAIQNRLCSGHLPAGQPLVHFDSVSFGAAA
jgi:acetate kinase